MKQDALPRLEPFKYYHIYNQGNNCCNIFSTEDNYEYFLKKYFSYISKYADTLCYCLLPDHFHFLICIKDVDFIIKNNIDTAKEKLWLTSSTPLEKDKYASEIISESFRRFFMSYSKAFNKQNNRSGSLFRKNFKRKEIINETHLRQIVYYIHRNPWHHNVENDFMNYRWSSLHSIIREDNNLIDIKGITNLFENMKNLIIYHNQRIELDKILEME